MSNTDDWKRIVVGGIAALGGIATIGWTLWYLTPVAATSGGSTQPGWAALDRWQALGMLAVAVGIAFGVAAMLRFALAPLIAPSPAAAPSADADITLRSRIAPIVLSIGSIAIVVLALGLIIAFVVLTILKVDPVVTKIDTLLTGVFSTVLPVVATWVGTVLAFYFGSENFRQAAQNTREALSGQLAPKSKITDVMIPFERIASLDADSKTAAGEIKIEDVINTMSEAATRVIIFNKGTQVPIYVIRSGIPPMPDDWITADYKVGSSGAGKFITDYLAAVRDGKKNQDDAENFRFIAEDATPEAALALMAKEKVDDLFITKDGQPTSRVLGWVASHDLRPK